MKRCMILGIALSLVLILGGESPVQARDAASDTRPAFVDENGDGIDDNITFRHRFGRWHGRGFGLLPAPLTEEQRAALKDKIAALVEDGATKDEIREAVYGELKVLGIDVFSGYFKRLDSMLTDEQRAALQEKVDALKAEDATYAEIHEAIRADLESLGVAEHRKGFRGFRRLYSVLTDEQIVSLQEKIDALKTEGATRDEIRTAAKAELEALDVEVPDGRFGRRGFGHLGRFRGHGGWRGEPVGETDGSDGGSEGTSGAQ